MKGLSLRSFRLDLHKIEPDSRSPASTITDCASKLQVWADEIFDRYGDSFEFLRNYHWLPLEALKGFSFDELCKLYHSSTIMMDRTVNHLFETRAQHEVVRKIENSMWRWGSDKGTWNEIVDAYDNLRHFTFIDDPNFEIRLDYATYFNPYGYSKYSRVYIDGAFAFLVYYKQKHVMTIGFSILDGRRVLIQQVQGAHRSGNRYLFKLPKNRVELVVDLFLRNFPGYALFVIDGSSLTARILTDYRRALQHNYESQKRIASSASPGYLQEMREESEQLQDKILHLEEDESRLALFYRNVGRHRLGLQHLTTLNLSHYPIVPESTT